MKYLSEEKYRKTKRKLLRISIFVLLLGFSIGIGVILTGVRNKIKLEEYYSEENRIRVSEQVDIERTNLEKRKEELENKGIEYDESTDYLSGEEYELYCIKKVLTLDFDWCSQDEYKNNGITHKYCKLKNELYKIGDTFNKKIEDNLYIYCGGGGFIIFATILISWMIYICAKGREMAAYNVQQAIPIVKEGVEEMTPNISNAFSGIAKGIKTGLDKENRK